MAVTPQAIITGATRTPLPYGLFSTFGLRGAGDRWESGVQWEAGTCDPAGGIGDLNCATPASTIGLPKDLDANRAGYGESSPFVIYGHFQCSPVGWTPQSAQDEANVHLLNREEARVEQAFWTGDLGNYPNLMGTGAEAADPTVLAGVQKLANAFGALEEWIATDYGSLGVIHVTRGVALRGLAAQVLNTTGGRLTTALGTPVAAGAGYPGTGPTAGTNWAFVTPAVFGYRSEVFTSSNNAGDLFDRRTNDLFAIAERSYLLGFDPCGVAAVQIDTTA